MLAAITPMHGDTAPSGETRSEARSNLFVMATLSSAGGSGPVRIRNMSRGGALIEGGVIPAVGSPIRLNRGTLSVSGRIAWHSGNKAGIRFDSTVAMADWLPKGIGTKGQQRVDETVFQYKSGARPAAQPVGAANEADGDDALADELLNLKRRLQAAAVELADCAATTQQLLSLQLVDTTAQDLEKIARRLISRASADR